MPSAIQSNGQGSLVEYLASKVRKVDPSELQSVHRYLQSAQLVLTQAGVYRKYGNEEQLYLMLLRFASLMIETVPRHSQFNAKNSSYIQLKKVLKTSCLQELEELKTSLSTKSLVQPKPAKPKRQTHTVQFGTSLVPEIDWGDSAIPQPSNGSLIDAIPSASMAPPPQFNLKYSRSAKGTSLEKHGLFGAAQPDPLEPAMHSSQIAYPAVEGMSLIDAEPPMNPVVSPPPELELGPQQVEVEYVAAPTAPPDPSHTCCTAVAPVEKTVVKREGLREVQISFDMMKLFLHHVESNTRKGIETCAVLAGELGGEDDVLRVNALILPPQKGSRDQVEMLNEEILLEETVAKGLIVMGWIHTHPEFECFLSSVDVHTTLGFQILLEEALAIVMAPKDTKRKCGVFRLTTPGGMDLIQGCPHRGFHSHSETKTGQPIYEVCNHVFINPRLKVSAIDRRAG
ncbi:hypothetical protein BSKO_03437 [Bryopsis sp. KO-2023]|nr:hypothetical protein BSKO_03437 [Bryopsis sp. KO-2023]